MTNNPLRLNKRWVRTLLLITFSSIILYFLLLNFNTIWKFVEQVFTILQPVLIGVVLAYLMSPICDRTEIWIEKKLKGRFVPQRAENVASFLSVTICILIIIGAVASLFSLIFPQLFSSIAEVVESGISSESEVQKYISKYFSERPEYMELLMQGLHSVNTWLGKISSQELIPNMVTTVSKHLYTLGVSVFNFFIGIIVSAYCLSKRKAFSLQFKKILYAIAPNEEKAQYFLQKVYLVNTTFLGFFIGKLIDSLIIGILCFVGTMILGIPHALLVSVIIGITNIIPFFGPFIGAVPATIIILLADPIKALYFLIFIFLLQQFDGNILGPKILGNSTGLSSFWVLFSILLFGGLWGIVGMIIAVPLFAVIYNLVKEVVDDRLRKKNLPTKAYCYEGDVPTMEKESEKENRKA